MNDVIRDAALEERNARNRAEFYEKWWPTRGLLRTLDRRPPAEARRVTLLYRLARERLEAFFRSRRTSNVVVFSARRGRHRV